MLGIRCLSLRLLIPITHVHKLPHMSPRPPPSPPTTTAAATSACVCAWACVHSDALLYDGAGKSVPGVPDPGSYAPSAKIGLDIALGFVVDFVMLPVTICIISVFNNVATMRQQDTMVGEWMGEWVSERQSE